MNNRTFCMMNIGDDLHHTKAIRMTHSYDTFIQQTWNLVYTKCHTKQYTTKCNLSLAIDMRVILLCAYSKEKRPN